MIVFFLADDTVLHTRSGYGLITDLLFGTDIRLDLTPLGRQDEISNCATTIGTHSPGHAN